MVKNMKWLKHTKAGSYIVEAVIVVPVFIMAVLMLITIVPIIASCENAAFAAADEMSLETMKSVYRENPLALPAVVRHRMTEENPKMTSYRNREYRYLYTEKEIDDLISLKFRVIFEEKNPMGLFSRVVFDGRVTARAFTGKIHKEPPMADADEEDDKIVYIFPEWGKRYHGKNCTYVKANCQMVYLSQQTKGKYKPCKLCHARSAQIGSPVFCFTSSGQVFHTAECRMVDKYYIETTKKICEEKGYTPCSKCGGG